MSERRLEIDGVSKSYGEVVALREMTFDVRAGEVFGFVGGNGAGKTTTMRIALGVLSADAGQVRWDGAAMTPGIRNRMGYMPEERGLYPRMRVGEQLEYLARLHGMSRADAGRATREWTERLGVTARLGDEVQKLSLGNQQRVQLAAALVHDPEILVLDEPFSGLDPVAVEVMSGVLCDKADAGVPVIFSSHQLELVERICSRVGIVDGGSMVACGRVGDLRSGGADRIVVDAPQAPPGWADDLPGVTVIGAAERAAAGEGAAPTLLELAPGADDQAVLRAALATGPVREFARRRPSLTELFHHVVNTHAPEEAA